MPLVGQASFGGVPAPGDVIASKYQVESILGAGGMGVVLCARHVQLGQRVAIKFIRNEAALNASAASRFLREARAAVALSSENVAKVLDVGTLETGEPYMVMEYLDGIDLDGVLRSSGPLSVEDAVSTLLQACEAIAEAHMLGIVHRDLKPSNLFRTIRRDGSQLVKVLDFGISKTVAFNSPGSVADLTASGSLIGSPGYMSPEQVRSAKAVDTRTDIWSLGVILYEFLAGQAPFTGETLGETFARILSEPLPNILVRRPDVPEGLAQVIARCFERNIERRTPTVAHLALQLAPFASKNAALSVERIARICGASLQGADERPESRSASPVSGATAAALATGVWSAESARKGRASETSPAWLKGSISSRRGPRWPAVTIAVASAIVLVFLVSLGIYRLGRKSPAAGPSANVAAAPAAVQAGAATTADGDRERGTVAASALARTEPERVAAPDAGPSPPRRSTPQPTPIRIETRRATSGRAPTLGSAEPGLENLLEQRQ